MDDPGGELEHGDVLGVERTLSERGRLGGDAVLQRLVPPERPEAVAQGRGGGVVPGDEERGELSPDVLVGEGTPRLGIPYVEQQADQLRRMVRVASALLDRLVDHGEEPLPGPDEATVRRRGPPRRDPTGEIPRSVKYWNSVAKSPAMASARGPRSCPRTDRPSTCSVSRRVSGSSSTRPALDGPLGGELGLRRHVYGEVPDVLPGEQGLERAPARLPGLVREVEDVQPDVLGLLVDLDALVHRPVEAGQYVVGAGGRGDDDELGSHPPRPDRHAYDRAAVVAQD